jgi:hypothetical protein
MKNYDRVVARALRQIKKPFPFSMDIVQHPSYVELRVYENQIMGMGDMNRLKVMEYLTAVQDIVSSYGIRCELGGAAGDPP